MVDKLQKGKDEEGTVRVGLMRAWEVVAAFPGDQLGAIFKAERGAVMNFLGVRNQSLFAHGATPIGERDYKEHAPVAEKFIRSAMGKALATLHKKRVSPLPQFPTEWN